MSKIHTISLMFALSVCVTSIHAEEIGNNNIDFQLRVPLHLQYVPQSRKVDNKLEFGIAGWAVLSDVMAKHNNTTSLFVCGPLLRYGEGGWAEVMGGCRR